MRINTNGQMQNYSIHKLFKKTKYNLTFIYIIVFSYKCLNVTHLNFKVAFQV